MTVVPFPLAASDSQTAVLSFSTLSPISRHCTATSCPSFSLSLPGSIHNVR